MNFEETRLPGAYIIELEPIHDNRGFFSSIFCQREFEALDLTTEFVQANMTYSTEKGTLRGLHYQIRPHKEIKLVHCPRGAIYDVILDLRPDSPTYLEWVSVELTAENRKMLYIPGEFAHGYQTLADDTEVFYRWPNFTRQTLSAAFAGMTRPSRLRGLRPLAAILSEKDKAWPDFQPKQHRNGRIQPIHHA